MSTYTENPCSENPSALCDVVWSILCWIGPHEEILVEDLQKYHMEYDEVRYRLPSLPLGSKEERLLTKRLKYHIRKIHTELIPIYKYLVEKTVFHRSFLALQLGEKSNSISLGDIFPDVPDLNTLKESINLIPKYKGKFESLLASGLLGIFFTFGSIFFDYKGSLFPYKSVKVDQYIASLPSLRITVCMDKVATDLGLNRYSRLIPVVTVVKTERKNLENAEKCGLITVEEIHCEPPEEIAQFVYVMEEFPNIYFIPNESPEVILLPGRLPVDFICFFESFHLLDSQIFLNPEPWKELFRKILRG